MRRGLSFGEWLLSRIFFYVKARKFPPWPHRFINTKQLFIKILNVFPDSPIRAIRHLPALVLQKIPIDGFILAVSGPTIFRDTIRACESVGIKPFLVFGTLLGHVREGGLIAHDDDIDLGFMDEDFQKSDLLSEAMLKKGYKVRRKDDYMISMAHPRCREFFIDFWRVYNKDGQMLIGMTGQGENNGKFFTYVFPSEVFSSFRRVTFLRQSVLIPQEPENFLSITYGNWKSPQKDFDYIYDHTNLKVEKAE